MATGLFESKGGGEAEEGKEALGLVAEGSVVLSGEVRRHALRIVESHLSAGVLDLGSVLRSEGKKALDSTLLDALGRALEESGAVVSELRLSGWEGASDTALRSLALHVGSQFRVLDASKSSADTQLLRVIPSRFQGLTAVDLSFCSQLTDSGVMQVVTATHKTLTALDLSHCERVSDDGVGWIAGQVGVPPLPCKRLLSLRLSHCPRVRDRSLWHVGRGLRQLRFLDLAHCSLVSDLGCEGLGRGKVGLRVLDIGYCGEVSDVGMQWLSRLGQLRSLAMRRLEWVSDRALWWIARGCPNLQALDISGCYGISEKGLYFVAVGCVGLSRVQADGVDGISERGLAALAKGRGRGGARLVEQGMGIEPTAEAAKLRLARQARMVRDAAALRIQCAWKGTLGRRLGELARRRRRLKRLSLIAATAAVVRMQRLRSEREKEVWRRRRAAKKITRMGRTWIAKRVEEMRRRRREEEEAAARVIDKVKARLRGRRVRALQHPEVRELVMLVRRARRAEAIAVAALRVQAAVRVFLAKRLVAPMVWERREIAKLRIHAATRIQAAARAFIAREQARARRAELVALARAVESLARQSQRLARGRLGRMEARWRRHWAIPLGELQRLSAAVMLQSWSKVFPAKKELERRREARRRKLWAAVRIQAVFRGSRVPRWRQLAVMKLRDKVRDWRASAERDDDVARARRRRARNLRGGGGEGGGGGAGGGGGEEEGWEEKEEDDWEEYHDPNTGWVGWWSVERQRFAEFKASGGYPPSWAVERDLARLRARVKVYEEESRQWRLARLGPRFVPTKRLFRVEFDDGEVRWMDAHKHHANVMILWPPHKPAAATWIQLRHMPSPLNASKEAGPYRKEDALQ